MCRQSLHFWSWKPNSCVRNNDLEAKIACVNFSTSNPSIELIIFHKFRVLKYRKPFFGRDKSDCEALGSNLGVCERCVGWQWHSGVKDSVSRDQQIGVSACCLHFNENNDFVHFGLFVIKTRFSRALPFVGHVLLN